MRPLSALLPVAVSALLISPLRAQEVPPSTLQGVTVVAYTSGTGFAVLDSAAKLKRIKLTGVDAPERKQRFAPEARQLASQWLGNKPFDITIDGSGKDSRLVGRVTIDGRDVGQTLIEAGLAWCDPQDDSRLPSDVRAAYRAACERARTSRQGLWQDANPTPPWEYRKIPEFDPLPARPNTGEKICREVGYQSVQCDDGKSYRIVGNEAIASDGSVYTRRGNTLTGTDGNRYLQQGTTTYGTDGSVCRQRGRQTNCF